VGVAILPIKIPRYTTKDKKPSLTDTERYKRFLDMAKEIGASDDPKDFEKAFSTVVHKKPQSPKNI
jgi:hypothetical protein